MFDHRCLVGDPLVERPTRQLRERGWGQTAAVVDRLTGGGVDRQVNNSAISRWFGFDSPRTLDDVLIHSRSADLGS